MVFKATELGESSKGWDEEAEEKNHLCALLLSPFYMPARDKSAMKGD